MAIERDTRTDMTARRTADQILDVAEGLAQTRGFNGFSYADISEALGITKASLHYHFRTKADLGKRLILRYREDFTSALAAIDASGAAPSERLERYADLFAGVLAGRRICLCGMLAAEHLTLPTPMREEIRAFFEFNERWLIGVLAEGRADGTLRFAGDPAATATLVLGALEGAMLVAHSYGDPTRFEQAARRLLDELAG